jgi:hypothetical protein
VGAILMFCCQVKCIQCLHESNGYEPMMDLLVDIQGNAKSMEDALAQFTDTEPGGMVPTSISVTSMCFSCALEILVVAFMSISKARKLSSLMLLETSCKKYVFLFQSCLILVCNVGKYTWIQDCTKLVKVDCKWLIQMA